MKDKILKTLTRCYCPNDFELDIKCNKSCSTENMKACWDIALKEYNLRVSENCDLRYKMLGYSFQFENKVSGGVKMLNKLKEEIHQNAVNHGWWEEERSFGDIIALCHSELSEALEEYRNHEDAIYYSDGKGLKEKEATLQCNKPEGIAIELADCIIRILDYCGKDNIDIEEAIRIKNEFNKSRPYRHGGKAL